MRILIFTLVFLLRYYDSYCLCGLFCNDAGVTLIGIVMIAATDKL